MEIKGWEMGNGQESGRWFSKGEDALAKNDPAEAIACFSQVLKIDPFSGRAHSRLSRAYWAQSKTEDALNCITRALELEPDDRDTIIECVRIFRELGKDDFAEEVLGAYVQRNPQDGAIRSECAAPAQADNLVEQMADVSEFFRKHGEEQFERGNTAHAVACFEMAIENNPGSAEAHNNLGVVYLGTGRLQEALEHFYKALDLNPRDPEVLGNSARALSRAGQIDTAVDLFREYLKREPQDDDAWLEFETLVCRSAVTEWKPEGLSKEVADIYIKTARQLTDAGDYAGAADAVSKALRINPGAVEALFVLGSLHNAIGQSDEAANILGQVLEIDPSHVPSTELLQTIRSNGNCAASCA